MLRNEEFALNFASSSIKLQLKAFGELALNQARTFEWFKCSKDGREYVEDCKHSC